MVVEEGKIREFANATRSKNADYQSGSVSPVTFLTSAILWQDPSNSPWGEAGLNWARILHGAEDVPYPLEKVAEVYQELRKAKVEFQMEFYSGAGHGFSVPKNKDEERANELSIGTATRFLKGIFGI